MEELRTQIKILLDSQEKKLLVLERLLVLTKQQEENLKSEEFDADKMEDCIRRKNLLINDLTKLDDGFEGIYSRVGAGLHENKALFRNEIEKLKQLITEITDLSVSIQTLEESNRLKMSMVMKEQKSEIKRIKMSSKTVAAYYKNMSSQNNSSDAYFLDEKK